MIVIFIIHVVAVVVIAVATINCVDEFEEGNFVFLIWEFSRCLV